MARKKRKYVRRKPLRHDTVPLSSLMVGLLPILLMAGIVGGYLVYQYTDIFTQTALPSVTMPALPDVPSVQTPAIQLPQVHFPSVQFPEVHLPTLQFPEITFSFPDVITDFRNAVGASGAVLLSGSDAVAQFVGDVIAMLLSSVHNGFITLVTGIGLLVDFLRDAIIGTYSASVAYIGAVSWTIMDFFSYLDIPGKVQSLLNTILWPLHFLDPRPAVQATSTKVHETNETVAHALAPIGPIFAYLKKIFDESVAELWQSVVDLWNFIHWLSE